MKIKLTEAKARSLPADDYQDSECAGLYLRVTQQGGRVYYCVTWQRESRKVVWDRIGPVGGIALDTARKEVQRRRGLVASGIDLAIERAARRAEPTLGELFEEYLAGREGQRSTEADREQFQRWIGALPDAPPRKHGRPRVKPAGSVDWSKRRVGSITQSEVKALVAGIIATGKRRTAGSVHELLHAAFTWGVEHGRCSGNPAAGVETPASEERERYARTDELPALLDGIAQMPDPWGDLFAVFLYVGYRRTAIQRMRWPDVDLAGAVWTVPATESKNGKATPLPLTGPAMAILRRRHRANKGRSEWVFPGGTADGHVGRPKRAWAALIAACGLSDLRPHDMRRTLGSHLAMSGESLPMIGKLLGHRDAKSTQIYARLELGAARDALDRVHKKFAKAAKPRRTRKAVRS